MAWDVNLGCCLLHNRKADEATEPKTHDKAAELLLGSNYVIPRIARKRRRER